MNGSDWDALQDFVRQAYGVDEKTTQAKVAGRNYSVSIQPYHYPVRFTNIAPGQQQPGLLTAAANSDFVITSIRYRCALLSNAGADDLSGDVVPKIRVQIQDTGSNQQFAADQVDISNLAGQIGKAPYVYMFPRIVNGRSSLQVSVQSYANADTYQTLELDFAGALVQEYG